MGLVQFVAKSPYRSKCPVPGERKAQSGLITRVTLPRGLMYGHTPQMKRITWLFGAFLAFELLFLGCSVLSQGDHPVLLFPIWPAIWIAMVIGGVHSAGF